MTVSGAELVELRRRRGERRWGWLVIVLGLLLVLGSTTGLGYWLTANPRPSPLDRYWPLGPGNAILYQVTYADGTTGLLSQNVRLNRLDAETDEVEVTSVFTNWQGSGTVKRRTDRYLRQGHSLALYSTKDPEGLIIYRPPRLTWPASMRGPVTGRSQADGKDEEITIVIGGEESVTVPAGDFPQALRVERTMARNDRVVREVTWYAPRVGIIQRESRDADGNLLQRWEILRASHAALPSQPTSPPELGGTERGRGTTAFFRGDLTRSGTVPDGSLPDAPMVKAWVANLGSPIASSPVVADGLLYIGAEDGVLYALDAAEGWSRWQFATGNAIASSPAIADGILYFGSGDKRVYALDARHGLFLWSFETLDNVIASPAVADGLVFVGSEDRTMYALDARTGALRWKFRTGDRIVSSVAVADGVVCFGSADGIVYALDAATSEVVWRRVTDGAVDSTPALSDGVLYVGSSDAHIYAIEMTMGHVLWASETRAPVVASPSVGPDIVYAGDQSRWLFALRRTDGKWAWRAKTGTLFTSSPLLVGDRLLFADATGGLHVTDADTGELLFSQPVDGAVTGSPTWADGRLYVGTRAGKVYAFRTSP